MTVATFGAGCFWGVELTFQKTKGVTSTSVGYTGGTTQNPTYEQVCTGQSGHAEVVRVEFDPSSISYEELLDVFWGCHDPTTLNRQGPDRGTQYRSAIYYHSPDQEATALASKEKADEAGRFKSPIVTEITPASEYTMAEDYHQKYLEKRGMGSCH
ncbi:MAG: peptide-methionine (S)-S-oxide reductase MsrA [Nitrospina sp.]|jgi:peptide-methionine (S)-S-oxide reductase|nr:peptide-methionine (S)-S-oxide reductase MsrA [Nitrospina sp.]MBT3414329.1 peptide-methionine (S)-S-oxide reductase MsrA [Nitrospina sp.]MBT3857477.1 peptide-methionine (S)-S-oxide reductase MsrA [Nitrospina sp.]MBT4104000.1 peptide-methionine (S)-S-oxide reductase MsrA [Nitrospina sp.]MBT4389740.1 peptide-methionine (S)-S-oxide reductase MsrA [Nitrospina sp.]